MRMPISGIYKIEGVSDVLAGRVEQGVVKPDTASNPCTGKAFTVDAWQGSELRAQRRQRQGWHEEPSLSCFARTLTFGNTLTRT